MLTLSLLLVKEQKEVKYRSILKHSLMVEITKKKKKGWYVVMRRVAVMLGYVCIGVCVWALLVQDMFVCKHVCVICMDTTSVFVCLLSRAHCRVSILSARGLKGIA